MHGTYVFLVSSMWAVSSWCCATMSLNISTMSLKSGTISTSLSTKNDILYSNFSTTTPECSCSTKPVPTLILWDQPWLYPPAMQTALPTVHIPRLWTGVLSHCLQMTNQANKSQPWSELRSHQTSRMQAQSNSNIDCWCNRPINLHF